MNTFQGAEPTPEDLAFVAQSYAMRQLYWPSYTWKIQTEQLNKIDNKAQILGDRGVNIEAFQRRKSDFFNKINASFYHLQKLKENEETIIALGKKMAKQSRQHTPANVLGIVGMPYEPINYEYEALLISLKTGIDIICTLLAEASGLSRSVDDLNKLLTASLRVKQSNQFLAQVGILLTKQQHAKTIDEFRNKNGEKSKRNFAVHEGSLPIGTINIQFTANLTDIGVLKTRTADLGGIGMTDFSKQQDLDVYASGLFYDVCDFTIEGLELLLDVTLHRGERMSVYEARLNRH